MLVLTRKPHESVRFPQFGIELQFIRCRSGSVKFGVSAPRDVIVLRGELEADESAFSNKIVALLPKEQRHELRNELNEVSVGLYLYRELVRAGNSEESEEIFKEIQASLNRVVENGLLKSPTSEIASQDDSSEQTIESDPARESCISVLVVEDSANEREMLAGLLRMKQMNVATAEDGNQAVDYFRNNPAPTFMILDMQMPNCDGATALRELNEQGLLVNTVVIVVSGNSKNAYEVDDNAYNQWLAKPIDPVQMISRLEQANG